MPTHHAVFSPTVAESARLHAHSVPDDDEDEDDAGNIEPPDEDEGDDYDDDDDDEDDTLWVRARRSAIIGPLRRVQESSSVARRDA
jgi:hypothetical protein